jgi:hypothetical protein
LGLSGFLGHVIVSEYWMQFLTDVALGVGYWFVLLIGGLDDLVNLSLNFAGAGNALSL